MRSLLLACWVFVALVFASFFVSSCAGSKPPEIVAGQGYHVFHVSLVEAHDVSRLACNPAVPLELVRRECSPTARALGLTDAKFKNLSDQFEVAFQKDQVYGKAVDAYLAGSQAAPDASAFRQTVSGLVDLVGAIGSPNATISLMLKNLKAVIDAIDAFQKSLIPKSPVAAAGGI